MSRTHTASILTAVLLGLGSTASAADDPITASFDRMLGHEASQAYPEATVARVADPLLREVAGALVTQWRPNPVVGLTAPPTPPARDAIAESFTRMFEHQATHTTPAVPAGTGEDPLYAAMVLPLRGHGGLNWMGPLHALIPQAACSVC